MRWDLLRDDPEGLFDEAYLPHNVVFAHPSHLPLQIIFIGFVPGDSSDRSIHRPEPHTGRDALLHESMILLRHIEKLRYPNCAARIATALNWGSSSKTRYPTRSRRLPEPFWPFAVARATGQAGKQALLHVVRRQTRSVPASRSRLLGRSSELVHEMRQNSCAGLVGKADMRQRSVWQQISAPARW